jgi:hypothetical protein
MPPLQIAFYIIGIVFFVLSILVTFGIGIIEIRKKVKWRSTRLGHLETSVAQLNRKYFDLLDKKLEREEEEDKDDEEDNE